MAPDTIAEAGALLLRYQLLRLGVTSGALSTSSHVIARRNGRPVSIEVSVVESGSLSGRTCEWLLDSEVTGDLAAFVDLSSEQIWLLTPYEVGELSTKQPDGTRRLFTYADVTLDPEKTGHFVFSGDFDRYLLEERAERIA
tara:strand:+ start:174 stop:596 length:423 start_codon:yes stop_codon:yes gene_type:complete